MVPLLDSARSTTTAERISAQRREVQAWQSLADRQRDNPALRFEVESSRVQLAAMLAQDGQIDEARSSLEKAHPLLQKLAEAAPENLRRRHGLARAWEALGSVQARSGQMTEARNAAQEAVAIAQNLAGIDSAFLYDLACALNLRGKLASSEADAKAAIAALHRAKEAGFDNDHLLDHLLQTDARLDGLRSRPEFPILVGKPN
jgi:tetratricopeptide (TPR) repeat protein